MISESKLNEIVNKIVAGYQPETIILFGSYAAGTADENSDLDFFIIKDSDIPRPMRATQVYQLLRGTLFPVDIIVYTPKEVEESKNFTSLLPNEVLKSGKILYERKY